MASKLRVLMASAGMTALTAWLTISPLYTAAQSQSQGFLTSKQTLLRPLADGVQVKPILSVADALSSGYTMASVPDGLGAMDNGNGTFDLFMNHELTAPSNLTDARISRLTLNKSDFSVVNGKYVVTGIEGYKRFCSSTMVGPAEGFDRNYYLTGEEDVTGKYGGIDIAVDPQNDRVTQLVYWGRMAWENTIALPWKGRFVLMSFDDSAPGGVYMFLADKQEDLFNGGANMYVFVADGGVRTEDKVNKTTPLTGRFVQIDKKIASQYRKGTTDEFEKAGGFKFVRPEDGTYDLNDSSQVYFNVTGRSQYTDTVTGKPYDAKGRTFSMKLDPSDPTRVTSLKPILSGDEGDPVLNPDNIAASKTHLIILEDENTEFHGNRTGRVWSYEIATGKLTAAAELTQLDYNSQPISGTNPIGETETSGVINVSNLVGKADTWLLDVQAHTLKVPQFSGTDEGGQLLAITIPGTAALQLASTPAPTGTTPAVATVAGNATSVPVASPTTGSTVEPSPTVASNPEPSTPATATPQPAQPGGGAGTPGDGGTGTIGMPRTGSSEGPIWLYVLALISTALSAGGLALRRWKTLR